MITILAYLTISTFAVLGLVLGTAVIWFPAWTYFANIDVPASKRTADGLLSAMLLGLIFSGIAFMMIVVGYDHGIL